MASIAFGVTGFLNLLLPWSMRAIMTVLGFDCSTTALPTTESSPPVPPNASATPAHSYGSIPQSHPPYSEQSDESSPTEA
ncbi:hypothetical protein DL93DRAFT_2091545 [Clavulina sp. PMI_390]|nr:hypothetical protein DL93DRAFT_2091545 [Clavulina sp. PMI_390]